MRLQHLYFICIISQIQEYAVLLPYFYYNDSPLIHTLLVVKIKYSYMVYDAKVAHFCTRKKVEILFFALFCIEFNSFVALALDGSE